MQLNVNILDHKAALFLEMLKSLDFVVSVETAEGENASDWWNELTEQDKVDLKQSLAQGKAGEEKPMEEVFKKYGL